MLSSGRVTLCAVPLDGNTTYTISYDGSTRVLTLTPSSGTAQTVTLSNDTLLYTADAPDITNKTNNVVQNDVANNVANGGYSLAEGYHTTASGNCSHTEGVYTTASTLADHAEGGNSEASGGYSHAEGYDSEASGYISHAEGLRTTASGTESHAEGVDTIASGSVSHAEGEGTVASGYTSHAGGRETIAQRKSQTAIGEYNIADTGGSGIDVRGNYVFIVGNGTAANARSDAYRLKWTGEVVIAETTDLRTAINNLGWTDVIE